MSTAIGVSLPRLATAVGKAISEYAVLGKTPGFTADFIKNKYPGKANFASAITHARAGNATMTDGYGPELVTNGNFSSSDLSDWTIEGGTASVDGGRLFAVAGSGGFVYASQSFTTKVGVRYILTLNLDGGTSTNNYVALGTSSNNSAYSYVNIGTGRQSYEVTFTATETTSVIKFSTGIGSGKSSFWDNVSVREMPVIKWGPHNLVTHSEDATEWTSTGGSATNTGLPDPSGGSQAVEWTFTGINQQLYNRVTVALADYTAKCWVKGISGETINLTGFGLVTLTGDWQLVSAPQNADSTPEVNLNTFGGATARVIQVWGAHVYRSDLGGMVDNPDQPPSRASYVPTTSSDKYLPRVGHHVYNGSAWVNEGVLAESESRVNLIEYSDFSGGWVEFNVAPIAFNVTGPDGVANSAITLQDNSAGGSTGNARIQDNSIAISASTAYTASVFVKAGNNSEIEIKTSNDNVNRGGSFNISTETFTPLASETGTIQNVGNGWYRCAVTWTSGADTSIALRVGFPTITLDGTNTIYLYGAQLEEGSTPSSYIPNYGAPSGATREAESFTIPSANLPWPTPQYIGDELVDNGDFSTDSDWTKASGASITDGQLVLNTGQFAPTYQTITTTTAGGLYRVTADLVSIGSGTWQVDIRNGTSSGTSIVNVNRTTAGAFDFLFVAGSSTTSILVKSISTGASAVFDNISVREINPLSVSIGMEGRMTYADNDIATEARYVQWQIDSNNNINLGLTTFTGRTGQLDFSQKIGGTLDKVQTSTTFYSPDVLIPYNFCTRHGSTFVNGAVDGVALTANTTPTALIDLSAEDMELVPTYMGTIGTFRVWDKDLGDAGIVEATNPSLEPSLSLTFEGTGTNSFVVNNWAE